MLMYFLSMMICQIRLLCLKGLVRLSTLFVKEKNNGSFECNNAVFCCLFIASIITFVSLNFIILIGEEDKPKTKVLTREYDVPNKQDNQELFDAGKMSPIVGLKFNTFHQTRV